MDPALAERKGRKRKAPAPPNPFTGEIENADSSNPFDDDEDKDDSMAIDTEEVNLFSHYKKKKRSCGQSNINTVVHMTNLNRNDDF